MSESAGILSKLFGRRKVLPSLEERISSFREVLHANNAALGYLADIQAALEPGAHPSAADVRRLVAGAMVETFRMVTHLSRLTGDHFSELRRGFDRIRRELSGRVEIVPMLHDAGLVVFLKDADASLVEAIGQKSGYLAEARRVLGGSVPEGFATTADAYRTLMAVDGLGGRIAEALEGCSAGDVPGCFTAAARITQMIENTPVPHDLQAAIQEALAAMSATRFAVRSSALQEGGFDVSFAGQYRSFLNVPPGGVVDAFRRVVASKYSPPAVTYRLDRGFDDDEVAMCCCVIPMIDARAAGVLYSDCDTAEGRGTLVQAVKGLGLSAVDGSVEPDSFLVDRRQRRIAARKRGHQVFAIVPEAEEGTRRVDATSDAPMISDAEVLAVAQLSWRLEAALATTVDVEWAVDRDGAPWVLQVRPQPRHVDIERSERPRPNGSTVLLEGGARVSGGVGAGVVVRVDSDLEILRCPEGAVVVTQEANPRLAVLLPRVAAIVAAMGEMTGHLATVARELRVPALFAVRDGVSLLPLGRTVTVDADARVVYDGRLEALVELARRQRERAPSNPNAERLAAVSHLITPLTLKDRLASGYSSRRCRTLHDIIRYCHQRTIEAMFALGDRASREGRMVQRLVSGVPIDCRILDLGGGVRPEARDRDDITVADLASVPMRALWRGMTDPRVAWNITKPVSLRGFASAIISYNFDADARLRAMGEPSYAFISDTYMNLNSRIGYHFSTVDVSIGELSESNYASFRFVGGSTGVDQRSRRAEVIERILVEQGFETDCRADLVNARIRHRPAAEIEEAVTVLGLLMTYVNHLDMVLVSETLAAAYVEAFLAGDYGFKGGGGRGQA